VGVGCGGSAVEAIGWLSPTPSLNGEWTLDCGGVVEGFALENLGHAVGGTVAVDETL